MVDAQAREEIKELKEHIKNLEDLVLLLKKQVLTGGTMDYHKAQSIAATFYNLGVIK